MVVKSSLSDRRRLQTAREIQRAALSLALRHSYEAVTTELISVEARIRQRTFFNYYLNKDAAIVGTAPCFDEETVARFCASSGQLLADLLQALRQLLDISELDRSTSQLIDRLLSEASDLLPIFHGSLKRLRDQIAALAVTRLGEDARPTPNCWPRRLPMPLPTPSASGPMTTRCRRAASSRSPVPR